jgi:PiT family inorganic phosphate transporter
VGRAGFDVLIGEELRRIGVFVVLWMVLTAYAALALGTLADGWRIVKTMGSRITRLEPVGGVAAGSSAAVAADDSEPPGRPLYARIHA